MRKRIQDKYADKTVLTRMAYTCSTNQYTEQYSFNELRCTDCAEWLEMGRGIIDNIERIDNCLEQLTNTVHGYVFQIKNVTIHTKCASPRVILLDI